MINEKEIRQQIEKLSLTEIKDLAYKHLLSNEKARLRKIKMRAKRKQEKEMSYNEKN